MLPQFESDYFKKPETPKEKLLRMQREPAFPCSKDTEHKGLTKLEYFTALALQGCLANSQYRVADHKELEVYALQKAETTLSFLYEKVPAI